MLQFILRSKIIFPVKIILPRYFIRCLHLPPRHHRRPHHRPLRHQATIVTTTAATATIHVVRTTTITTIMLTPTPIGFGVPAVSHYGSNYVNKLKRRFG